MIYSMWGVGWIDYCYIHTNCPIWKCVPHTNMKGPDLPAQPSYLIRLFVACQYIGRADSDSSHAASLSGPVGCVSDWWPGSCEFDQWGWQHSFLEVWLRNILYDHSHPSADSSMAVVNRLEDEACPVKTDHTPHWVDWALKPQHTCAVSSGHLLFIDTFYSALWFCCKQWRPWL